MKRTLPFLVLFSVVSAASAQSLEATTVIADDAAYNTVTNTSTGSAVNSQQSSHANGSHSASAFADFGILRAYATETAGANKDRPYDYDGMFATGLAKFTDSLRFTTAATLDDNRGYVTFQYKVDGNHSSSGLGPSEYYDPYRLHAATSSVRAQVSQNGTRIQELYQYNRAGELSYDDFLGKTQTVTLQFNWNDPFKLGLEITAAARTLTNTRQTATADLAHTALWGGITSVTDYHGNPVNYTLSSASGHDWSKASTEAVPEPATMAALGLGALAVLKRRRKG